MFGTAIASILLPTSPCRSARHLGEVRIPDGDRSRVESILSRSAVNLTERAAAYRKTGWSRFDPKHHPFRLTKYAKSVSFIVVHPLRNTPLRVLHIPGQVARGSLARA